MFLVGWSVHFTTIKILIITVIVNIIYCRYKQRCYTVKLAKEHDILHIYYLLNNTTKTTTTKQPEPNMLCRDDSRYLITMLIIMLFTQCVSLYSYWVIVIIITQLTILTIHWCMAEYHDINSTLFSGFLVTEYQCKVNVHNPKARLNLASVQPFT